MLQSINPHREPSRPTFRIAFSAAQMRQQMTETSAPLGIANRPLLTLCLMMATVMQALDTTIANVALPFMQGSLSATPDQITWVLTSYVIAAAIMTAPVGWLAGRLGWKKLYLASIAGFTFSSMLCGTATSLEQIVLYRLLQGMCGAALVPLAQSVILDIYPHERRGRTLALWGMGVMVGPILGPTLGGWLTESYGWRWVFYINLPFGVLSFLGISAFLPEKIVNAAAKFDWVGFAALSVGIGALQLLLDRGQQKDWFNSTEIIVEAVIAGIGFYLFLVQMLTADKPFVSRRLFQDRNFLSGFIIMFLICMVMLSALALLSPYMQNLAGYPVFVAGILVAPRGLGTMFAMQFSGRLVNRIDQRLLMLFGLCTLAYGLYQSSTWTPDVDPWTVAAISGLQGFGSGFIFLPLNTVAFATLAPDLRSEGASMLALIRNLGSAIGISVTSFLLAQNTQIVHAQLVERITSFNQLFRDPSVSRWWNLDTMTGRAALNAEVTRQAEIVGYVTDYRLLLTLTLLAIPLLLIIRRPRPAPG